MDRPAAGLRNDSHLPGEAELIARTVDPPTYLSRIVRADLLDFSIANIRGDEDKGEVLISFG